MIPYGEPKFDKPRKRTEKGVPSRRQCGTDKSMKFKSTSPSPEFRSSFSEVHSPHLCDNCGQGTGSARKGKGLENHEEKGSGNRLEGKRKRKKGKRYLWRACPVPGGFTLSHFVLLPPL